MTIWQTNNWKELLIKSKQAEKVIQVDGINIEKRKIWLWFFWLFWLWISWENKLNEKKMIEICKKENCVFLQIETFWINNLPIFFSNSNKFKIWYYKKFITPYTAIIDLEKSIDEILSLMKPKWRYNINLSQKKWVEAFIAEKTDENIEIFYNLMLETTSRDGFSWNTINYYKNFLHSFNSSQLIFTKYQDKILSAWIFIFDKELSIYYYWASTSEKEYRNIMAPYLMQFFAINYAKNIWSKYYDFLWISSPNDKNSKLEWVTDFKLKFTKNTINCSQSYIYVNNPIKYFLLKIIKKMKSYF